MSIDFEGLRNAANKGKKYLKDEEEKYKKAEEDRIKKINEEARKECAVIKQDFIRILNKEFKYDIERGKKYLWSNPYVKADNIIFKYYNDNKIKNINKIDLILLSKVCDEFNDKQFEKILKDKANLIFKEEPVLILRGNYHGVNYNLELIE